MSEFGIVRTTVDTKENARKLVAELLKEKLAACVQSLPISSSFVWEGAVQEEDEILLLIKIKAQDYRDVEQLIRAHHSYDTPQIIMTLISKGSSDYLDWICEVTR